ncbi:D-2-hydroxyacid dehydrogenase [Spiractinospora alimapuensis]|uniref:D-2-hydroxyacid dehydrogenase n=1 Tax=Spiractinospora alimapuensis TaxID=2820884 RepID=UPI001F41746C|nr:D-2-hydroxyacid dehydrogenase [Spiractinospora alimapuensis]
MAVETPPRVVVLSGGAAPPGAARLDSDARLAQVRYVSADELAGALPGADVLLVWDLFSRALVDAWGKADQLRWIHAATAGVDNLMFPELTASDVVLTNSRGIFDQSIAEYVLGLVLAYTKDLPGTLSRQTRHEWEHRETERVAGKRALVIGTGPIGRAIARQLSAVGLTVRGLGRTARTDDPDFTTVHPQQELHTAVSEADFVVLAAPLTEATHGMIDDAALRAMRPSTRVINIGRGPLVVERDLVAALRDGAIAGAALDVFESEPLPTDSPLWDMPGVIVSPHMSGDTVGWRADLAQLFYDNLDRYLDGRELRNIVDKRRGYVPHG